MENNEVSLFEELKRFTCHCSLITSYNVFFPFYENVVLPKLIGSGIRNNILLIDAGQCIHAFRTDPPRLAGSAYTLLPVPRSRCFHPKLMFLLGKNRGRLFVGSHNVTLSGFGVNQEVTGRIEFELAGDPSDRESALSAWTFLREWIDPLAPELEAPIRDFEDKLGSLCGEMPESARPRFYSSSPSGESLWMKVRPFLVDGREWSRVTVLGPYFDEDLGFLRAIGTECSVGEMIVGFDIRRSSIPRNAPRLLPEARFVDAAPLFDSQGFIHAKAMLFESRTGEVVLITGSANPGGAAWLRTDRIRNAECVLISQFATEEAAANRFLTRLRRLGGLAPISPDGWSSVGSEVPYRLPETDLPAARVCLAFPVSGGFRLDQTIESDVRSVDLVDRDAVRRTVPFEVIPGEGSTLLKIPGESMGESVIGIELVVDSGSPLLALIHQTAKVARLTRSSSQQAIEQAFASLDAEDPDLEGLLNLVSRVIFDDESASRTQSRGGATKGHEIPEVETVFDSFSADEPAPKSRRLGLEQDHSMNLLALVDALIRKLADHSEVSRPDFLGLSEEELPGTEDQAPSEGRETFPASCVDGHALLRHCQSRLKTLAGRMASGLRRDGTRFSSSRVLQSIAVLSVLVTLRRQEPRLSWLPDGHSLIPSADLRPLWEAITDYLFSRVATFSELTEGLPPDYRGSAGKVLEWTLWLAIEAGVDLRLAITEERSFFSSKPHSEPTPERIFDLARLASVLTPAVEILDRQEMESRILTCVRPNRRTEAAEWVRLHLTWADRLKWVQIDFPLAKDGSHLRIGDLAVVRPPSGRRHAHFVLDASSETNCALVCWKPGGAETKKFGKAFVRKLDFDARRLTGDQS
jgi:hypothetical protein